METKYIKSGKLKTLKSTGEFEAVFATLGVVDMDSDIIAKGAVPQGQPVKIAAWGHKWDNLPAGKGKIYERGDELIVDGQFFMDTQAGVETYKTVKNLGDLQEWSFGFEIIQSHEDRRNRKTVRVLDSLNVFEVSPVLVGAGVNTRTTAIKSKKAQTAQAYKAKFQKLVDEMEEAKYQHIEKMAGREFARMVIRELDEMQSKTENLQIAELAMQNKTVPIREMAKSIARNSGWNYMTEGRAMQYAEGYLYDLAKERVKNMGINEGDYAYAAMLQDEFQRIKRWAAMPQDKSNAKNWLTRFKNGGRL